MLNYLHYNFISRQKKTDCLRSTGQVDFSPLCGPAKATHRGGLW